jgi:hypothetical protein
MSYAPNSTAQRSRPRDSAAANSSTRGHGGTGRTNGSASRSRADTAANAPAKTAPRGRPFDEAPNWKQIGMLAGGIAAGAAVGAGIALLFTEKTGPQRRAGIARRARHLGHDAEQRWEDLAFTLKEAARSTRDRFRHRHAADDESDTED